MINYNEKTNVLTIKIQETRYRIETFFHKKNLNFAFKVYMPNNTSMTLTDIDEFFSFIYHFFNKKHRKELFETLEEQQEYEQCYFALLGHAYWVSGLIWDYRRSLGHKNSEIIKDFRNGCGKLSVHLKEQQTN